MTFFNPKHESWIYKLYKQKAMKTAMQQAIELVKKYDNREIPMKVLLYNLELLQEKEKEQMLNEWQRGFDDAKYIYEPKK